MLTLPRHAGVCRYPEEKPSIYIKKVKLLDTGIRQYDGGERQYDGGERQYDGGERQYDGV